MNFVETVPASVVASLKQISGVRQIETFRAVPVRLRNGQYSRQIGITGLSERRDLFRLLDKDESIVEVPRSGLVVSSHLAGILHVGVGDEITIEVLEKERPVRKGRVVALVDDYSGSSAYMHIEALNRLMREPPAISGAFMTLDSLLENRAFEELKEVPFIGAVNLQKAAFEGFMESFAENMLQFQFINAIFACVIAFGVVYNSARIALSERSRELATLRVIGFTKGEVSGILLGELALLTSVAIPFGWLIGYGMSWGMVKTLPTEHFRIPLVLSSSTYGFAALVIASAAIVSGLIVRRGVDRLDLVSVLKSSE
ncbi:MAG: ABC transporter permease [Verrucomicrobiales bacterium]|nr:ABC transporter permease [Verrucomicrobiales bacterium]